MLRLLVILTLASALWTAPGHRAISQTDDASAGTDIRRTVAALQDAFNRADAKSLAACWVPDGEFVGPAGNRIVGAEQIENAFGEYFAAHKDSKLQLGIAAWRLVADDVAVVDLMTELTPFPEHLHSEPASMMVLVQRDGFWKIASMYETLSIVPPHRLHLKKLQWLLGEWMEKHEPPASDSLRMTCDWNSTGQYMIRKFLVDGKEGGALSGTEVIGWDPREHRIRSWSFHPDGGFGESTWTRDGNQWVIDHRGTLANGHDLSVTYRVTPLDADTLEIEVEDKQINGETQSALPTVTLRRRLDSDAAEARPIELPKRVLP